MEASRTRSDHPEPKEFEMTDTGFTSTRRAVLGAVAALPAIVAISAPALATVAIDRRAWDKAFSAMLRAKAVSDAEDVRHDPIWKAYRSACNALPHTTVTARDAFLDHRELSTASQDDVFFAQGVVRAAGPDNDQPLAATCRLFLKAVGAREAEERRIGDRLGYHKSAETLDDLADSYFAQCSNLMTIPAPDAPALLWKLEHLFGTEVDRGDDYCSGYSTSWMGAVMSDARRLLDGRA